MPKRGREPGGRRVALLASVRKAESRMVCRPLIVRRVARVAVRGKRIEPAIRMAASTSQAGVGARQWKTSVIISRRTPAGGAVALIAGMGEALTHVAGRRLIGGGVAGIAIRRNTPQSAARMAATAIQARVGARQRKTSVIVPRRAPAGDAVALIAGMGEALSHVAGRRLIGGGVTGIAVRRDSPQDAARMATGAVQSGMPAREPEEVVTHKRLLPAKRRVATLTVGRPSAGGMIRGGRPRQVGPVPRAD
jgi:hypothetical protein